MMTGHLQRSRPLLPVTFRFPGKQDLAIEFVVDTGFSGFLTLPLAAVSAMGLPYLQDVSANLADDSRIPVPVHEASIVWHGAVRSVRVLATGRRPLLGCALLNGLELVVQFREGGLLTIEEMDE